MSPRGKLIALEGIDGSGKRTQMEMLSRELRRRGVAHVCVSFPCYEGFFGRMVARYLNGEFGNLNEVDPHFSALIYANDRLEHKAKIEGHLKRGKTVLADRYIASNLAHQTARMPAKEQKKFMVWLEKLEYEMYDLPKEDLVIYLRVPAEEAQRMVSRKGARVYTRKQRDIQEANLAHLRAAARIFDRLSRRRNWKAVECVRKSGREMLSPDEIHGQVLAAVRGALSPRGRS